MRDKRIVLIGNGTLAARGLKALLDAGFRVPLVLADSNDNGVSTWRESLIEKARCFGYGPGDNLIQPKNPNHHSIVERIQSLDCDAILSLQCKRLIRKSMIEASTYGVINLHNAPLPLLRGCAPFAWAIHDGLKHMGVTLHKIEDEGVDNGPILSQRTWEIAQSDTAWSLYHRALDEAVIFMREVLPSVLAQKLQGEPQDERYVTYHPMGQFDFSALQTDWSLPAATLSARLRSRIFPPLQLPFFTVDNKEVRILKCHLSAERGSPGTVLSASPLRIAAKWGSIVIEEVLFRGESMRGQDFSKLMSLVCGAKLA